MLILLEGSIKYLDTSHVQYFPMYTTLHNPTNLHFLLVLTLMNKISAQSITPIFTSQKRLKAADWSEQPLSNINKRIILHGCLEGY